MTLIHFMNSVSYHQRQWCLRSMLKMLVSPSNSIFIHPPPASDLNVVDVNEQTTIINITNDRKHAMLLKMTSTCAIGSRCPCIAFVFLSCSCLILRIPIKSMYIAHHHPAASWLSTIFALNNILIRYVRHAINHYSTFIYRYIFICKEYS